MREIKPPWEQEWEYDEDHVFIRDGRARVAIAREVDGGDGPLIAAAPEMARLLLEMQWCANLGQGYSGCEFCQVERQYPLNQHEAPVHREDCRLLAVLRKAGVIG